MTRERGVPVPPLSRTEIRRRTQYVWNFAKDNLPESAWSTEKGLPIVHLLEFLFPEQWDQFIFQIRSFEDMGDDHGRTRPDLMQIQVREDVYRGALEGKGRDRLTFAHELGHLLLHRNVETNVLHRKSSEAQLPAYRDSEWQADCFGGELLAPWWAMKGCSHPYLIAPKLGVSNRAAEVQFNQYRKEGLL